MAWRANSLVSSIVSVSLPQEVKLCRKVCQPIRPKPAFSAIALAVSTLLIHPGIKSRSLEPPEFSDLNRVNLSAMHEPLQCSRVNFQRCRGLMTVEQGLSARFGVKTVVSLVCARFRFVLHLCSFRQQRDKIAISARFIHDGSDV